MGTQKNTKLRLALIILGLLYLVVEFWLLQYAVDLLSLATTEDEFEGVEKVARVISGSGFVIFTLISFQIAKVDLAFYAKTTPIAFLTRCLIIPFCVGYFLIKVLIELAVMYLPDQVLMCATIGSTAKELVVKESQSPLQSWKIQPKDSMQGEYKVGLLLFPAATCLNPSLAKEVVKNRQVQFLFVKKMLSDEDVLEHAYRFSIDMARIHKLTRGINTAYERDILNNKIVQRAFWRELQDNNYQVSAPIINGIFERLKDKKRKVTQAEVATAYANELLKGLLSKYVANPEVILNNATMAKAFFEVFDFNESIKKIKQDVKAKDATLDGVMLTFYGREVLGDAVRIALVPFLMITLSSTLILVSLINISLLFTGLNNPMPGTKTLLASFVLVVILGYTLRPGEAESRLFVPNQVTSVAMAPVRVFLAGYEHLAPLYQRLETMAPKLH